MLFSASVLLLAASSTVQAIPRITRSGRYLYDESGSRFYIKGVAYQEQGAVDASEDNPFLEPSSFTDPLAQPDACRRDLPILQDLGVNTIRVYSVDFSLNHDECMKLFSDANIYTIIDLSLPLNGSIDRTSPAWSTNLLDLYTNTIDVFSSYENAVLAYNVGNEVMVAESTSPAPFVKAAARDIKAYLNSKSSSALVGYAAINGATDFRQPAAEFLTCDPSGNNDGSTSIDLYGLNSYSWCGDSTFEDAYSGINTDFQDFNVAAYFSEYGCVVPGETRPWSEVPVLFGEQMTPIWSGGIAFSYFPAASAAGEFGMVTISDDQSSVTTSTDFDNLKTQYGSVSFINDPAQSGASESYGACPTSSASFAASSSLPPTPNEAACTCLENALSCQFTPATANYSDIVGELINYSCSNLLPTQGANCDEIGANGTTGTYGRLSGCDPTVKLSYLMSEWYELSSRDEQACSFSGNGTVNSNTPSTTSSAGSLASSCISDPSAVFTPSAAPDTPSSDGSNGSGSSDGDSSSDGGNAAVTQSLQPVVALLVVAVLGLGSAVLTLA